MAASGYYDVLTVVGAGTVGHRGRLAAGGQAVFPQLATCFQVECPEKVVHGGADEYEVAGGCYGAPHMGGAKVACWCEPRPDVFGGPERYLPHNAVSAKVDTDERAPWWSSAR